MKHLRQVTQKQSSTTIPISSAANNLEGGFGVVWWMNKIILNLPAWL
jgi:hypothetical protein